MTLPMTKQAATQEKRGKYAKSALTRETIIAAAFPIFGSRGLDAASTRDIAAAAGVNQPAINYHFGSKEQLYRACAEAVVKHYQTGIGPLSSETIRSLSAGCSPTQAERLLTQLIEGLAAFMVGDATSQNWVNFVVREMSEQGEAAHILHKNIWRPGTELVARLIEAMWGESPAANPSEKARLEALLLIANLVAFTNGRPVSMQILDWDKMGQRELEKVKQAMAQRVKDISARSA